jgi:WD40 repeat protein
LKCYSSSFSPDGRLFAWNQNKVIHLWDLTNGRERPPLPGRVAHFVFSMAFLPDNRHMLIIGESFDLEIWDLELVRRVDVVGRGAPSAVQVGPTTGPASILTLGHDARRIALGLGSGVSIGDLGRKRFPAALPVEQGTIWALAWSPDGQTLAVGTSWGGLALWDITKVHAQLRTLGLDWEGDP